MTQPFELSRKSVHLLSLFVPLGAYYSLAVTQLALVFFIILYTYSEWRKVSQKPFFLHPLVLRMQREEERLRWALAPLWLAIGILIAITLFSWKASLIGVYQAGFCDTVAALAGKKWGKTRLPFFARKTYAGSLVFIIAALPVAFALLPPSRAIVLALVGAFLESLPFKDMDNLLIPVFVTFLAEQFLF